MTLDPAPPELGDDVARVRATARRQWLRRRDIERQLHDGAALRISALTLRLGLLRHSVAGGEHDFRVAVEDLQEELHLVLQELREIAGRLYPPLLDEAGLGPALREVAARAAVPVQIDASDERFGAAVEGAAYFAVLGCLPGSPPDMGEGMVGRSAPTRIAAPAPDRPIDVVIRRDGDTLVLLVTGVAACQADMVHDAVRLLGGTVAVDAGGVGTAPEATVTVRIPCA
jgi:histidine kinase